MKKLLIAFVLSSLVNVSLANEQMNDYEMAVKAFHNGEENEAFIYLKNALKADPQHLSSKLLLAKVYFYANNLGSAEKQLREALEMGADINLVLPLLGNVLLLQNKTDELLALADREHEFSKSTQFEWKLLQGQVLLKQGQTESAKQLFEQATQLAPGKTAAMNSLAMLYLQQKQYTLAEQWIERSLAQEQSNERTWLLKGDLVSAKGDLTTALQHYQRAYELDPKDPKVLRSLVIINLKMDEVAEAKRYLKLVQQQTPNDPTAILLSASLLSEEDGKDIAEQALATLAQNISTADGEQLADANNLLFIQGASEYILNNDEKAQQYLSQYLRQQPSDLAATRLLAKVYLRNGEKSRLQLLLQDNFDYIIGELALSSQLVYLYLEAGNLYQAQQAFEEIRAYHSGSPYVVLLEAELARASGEPQRAYQLLSAMPYQTDDAPLKWLQIKGELALQLGLLEDAKDIVNALQQRNLQTENANNLLAAYYIKTEQNQVALSYLDKVLAVNPDNLSAAYNKAVVYQNQGQFPQALALLETILAEHKQHAPSHLLMANIYFQQQQYKMVIEQLDTLLNHQPDNRTALELKLTTLSRTQQWEEALQLVKKLNREYILNQDYLRSYAEVLIQLQRFDEADYPLDLLISLWEDQALKLIDLASLQIAAQKPNDAKQSLLDALELDPSLARALLMLTSLELSQGQLAAAAKTLDKFEAQFSQTSQSLLLRGRLLLAQGKAQQAQKRFSSALAKQPLNREAAIHLYQLASQNIGVEAFHQQMEATLNDGEQMFWQRRLLADSYLQHGQNTQAIQHYEVLRKSPQLKNEPGLLNNLANLYALDDLDKAFQTINIVLQQGVKSAAILDTAGWIEQQRGNQQQALVYLREAYTMNASDPSIRYHLAVVLNKLNRPVEAKRELEAALESEQDIAEYEQAKALLDRLN
ncbi:XrtA/PEP-CTERM system TPR-repeat protein PrsT [Agarivorans gilvus]|uniref:Lipoprotein n=1 Tax=Agarivorans gilvus TaxID=680279 RepID=A0ABQ1I265_9ALTE|nr:XrtA/PEP-CTERM system TPR-repeat protein PrsT [Agarivorans gilvus]GGB09083.1 lipoprotein [Agarivorans gilvus]